jgi:type I restriction enzyme, S subunit
MAGNSKSAIKGNTLNSESIAALMIPLPPLAEQLRIVTKVDELMALCDQLEAQHNNATEAHEKIVSVLLETLTQSTDAKAFTENWQRIAAHFDTLFTTETSIDALKKTLLQLAVKGKLVPQDSIEKLDEKLLIAPNKAERNKHKWAEPIEEQEKPFRLPPSWIWLRLGDISSLKHGYAFSSTFFTSETAPFVLTTPGNFYEKGGFRDRESKRKYYSGPVDPEFIFKPGDLMIPMTEQAAGLLGSPAFIPDDGLVYLHNQRLGKINCSEAIAPEFAFWFFNSEFFRGELARTCTGMKVRHTSPDRVLKVPFPVCPLAEQHRIVTKVDELMALCDQLKSRITAANQLQQKLADVMIEKALV